MGWEYRLFFRQLLGGNDGGGDTDSSNIAKQTNGISIVDELYEKHNLLPHIHQEDSRTDIYIPHSADVGIKYRDVVVDNASLGHSLPKRLEVKLCSSRRVEDSGFERWNKYKIKENELPSLLKHYGHDVKNLMTAKRQQQQVELHKTRRWGATKNGLVFVEETQLRLRRQKRHYHDNSNNNNTSGSNTNKHQQKEAKDDVEYWTTVSIEGNNVQSCLKFKDIVQDLCRAYANEHGDDVVFECGYPEFVQKIAFESTDENNST